MNLLIPKKIYWKPFFFLLFVIVFPSMLESSASEKNAAQMARYVNCQPYAYYTHTHTGCIFTWHTSQNCSEKGMKNIPILLG